MKSLTIGDCESSYGEGQQLHYDRWAVLGNWQENRVCRGPAGILSEQSGPDIMTQRGKEDVLFLALSTVQSTCQSSVNDCGISQTQWDTNHGWNRDEHTLIRNELSRAVRGMKRCAGWPELYEHLWDPGWRWRGALGGNWRRVGQETHLLHERYPPCTEK